MQQYNNAEVPRRTHDDGLDDLSDEAVIERVKAGDLAPFELIMRRYNQRLFRVARSIIGDDSEAEDIVQEAYVRAFDKLSQFDGLARFSTWLTRIAVYEAIARRRKRSRMQLFDPGDPQNTLMIARLATSDSAEEATMSELQAVIAKVVDELPANLRAVFTMRIVQGLGTDETADCLNLTASNVKIRLHRARSLLRNRIDQQIGEDVRRLYQFDGVRCDRIVERVLRRLRSRDN